MNTPCARPPLAEPDLRRSWLFVGGTPAAAALDAALACAADVVIVDLEDFTPPPRRPAARAGLAALLGRLRAAGAITAVRVNAPGHADAEADLAAAMAAGCDIVSLPMAEHADTVRTLCAAIGAHETRLGRAAGRTELLPVCETARGVADVRVLAAGIEPVDAPCTFADPALAVAEARHARRLGYRCKALVRPEHVAGVHAALTPSADELRQARAMVAAFDAARACGEERVLCDGLWVEVPTWRAAQRLIERARRLGVDG